MLQAMELGGPVNRDCRVDVVDSHYSVLGALEGKLVNVDELDYLANVWTASAPARSASSRLWPTSWR